jgi:hypothetical protein
MKRTILLILMLAGGTIFWIQSRAADRQTQLAMQAKLVYSKYILEGIVTEDFDQVASNAKKLHLLSQSADWSLRQTKEYQEHTREFSRQAAAIEKAATAKNLDGATLAYFQMTLSCVSCHRDLRGADQASVGPDENNEKLLASLDD